MAKKQGEHGDNLNRTVHMRHVRHVPAIAAEFVDAAFGTSEKDLRRWYKLNYVLIAWMILFVLQMARRGAGKVVSANGRASRCA
jgi:hypothetical protein